MKRPTILLALLSLLLAGCESTSMTDRFATVPPTVQLVDGEGETVYYAAQKAFKRLDFVLTRSTMGRIEAASRIKTSETFGDSRQTVAKVKIVQAEPDKCTVELTLTEEVGSSSMGGTRQQGLREHSLFELYFTTLQQVLQDGTDDKKAEKP